MCLSSIQTLLSDPNILTEITQIFQIYMNKNPLEAK